MRAVIFYLNIDYIPDGSRFLCMLPMPVPMKETEQEQAKRIATNGEQMINILPKLLYEVTDNAYAVLVASGFITKSVEQRNAEWAKLMNLPTNPDDLQPKAKPIPEGLEDNMFFVDFLTFHYDNLIKWVKTMGDKFEDHFTMDEGMVLFKDGVTGFIDGGIIVRHTDCSYRMYAKMEDIPEGEPIPKSYTLTYPLDFNDFKGWLELWDESFDDNFIQYESDIAILYGLDCYKIIPTNTKIIRVSKGKFQIQPSINVED